MTYVCCRCRKDFSAFDVHILSCAPNPERRSALYPVGFDMEVWSVYICPPCLKWVRENVAFPAVPPEVPK